MKLKQVEQQIKELEDVKKVLEMPIENQSHLIYRAYVETESLLKTKAIIDSNNIFQSNGNKFQVNDISQFIEEEHPEVDKSTRKLAIRLLKKHKTKR